jgi:hypothetical protein
VYLIGPESGAAVKVGKAVNLAARLSSLQTGSWEAIGVRAAVVVPMSVAKDVEALAHRRLAGQRTRGEWFAGDLEHLTSVVLGAARDVVGRVGIKNRLDLCNHICLAGDVEDVLKALSDYCAMNRSGDAGDINTKLLARVGLTAYGTFIEAVAGTKDLREWLIDNPKYFDEVEAGLVAALKALVDLKWDMRPNDMADLLQAANA